MVAGGVEEIVEAEAVHIDGAPCVFLYESEFGLGIAIFIAQCEGFGIGNTDCLDCFSAGDQVQFAQKNTCLLFGNNAFCDSFIHYLFADPFDVSLVASMNLSSGYGS